VANNALLEVPAFEDSVRGTNWLALIDVDGTKPGGLSRKFLDRGKGECFYNIEQVGLFDAIEFGADYTTTLGKRQRHRWYGVVVAKTDGALHVEEAKSGATAVLRAKSARESPQDRAVALRAERDFYVKKAAELEQELVELAAPADDPSGDQGAKVEKVGDQTEGRTPEGESADVRPAST